MTSLSRSAEPCQRYYTTQAKTDFGARNSHNNIIIGHQPRDGGGGEPEFDYIKAVLPNYGSFTSNLYNIYVYIPIQTLHILHASNREKVIIAAAVYKPVRHRNLEINNRFSFFNNINI